MSIAIQGINYIVVHHSASSFNAKVSDLKAGCLSWLTPYEKQSYLNQGYVADYHKFILANGKEEYGQPIKYWTANCGIQNINVQSLAICCVGNLQTSTMPEAMFLSLVNEVKYWIKLYKIPHERVMLHRDIVATACPGKYFPEKRFLEAIVSEKKIFSDMTGSESSFPSVKKAYEKGILSGFPDGTFRPRQPITREQLCMILDRLGLLK